MNASGTDSLNYNEEKKGNSLMGEEEAAVELLESPGDPSVVSPAGE